MGRLERKLDQDLIDLIDSGWTPRRDSKPAKTQKTPRTAASYRDARRNAIRSVWEWDEGFQVRVKVKDRDPWVPNPTPIKARTTVYIGNVYPAGWRTSAERAGGPRS